MNNGNRSAEDMSLWTFITLRTTMNALEPIAIATVIVIATVIAKKIPKPHLKQIAAAEKTPCTYGAGHFVYLAEQPNLSVRFF